MGRQEKVGAIGTGQAGRRQRDCKRAQSSQPDGRGRQGSRQRPGCRQDAGKLQAGRGQARGRGAGCSAPAVPPSARRQGKQPQARLPAAARLSHPAA